MHRPTVGVIALVLLIIGVTGQAWPSSGSDPAQFAPAFIRVGAVLGAFWLALPQTRQWQNKLLLGAIVLTAIVVAKWPKALPLLVGFMLVFALLRSRMLAHRPKSPEPGRDGKA